MEHTKSRPGKKMKLSFKPKAVVKKLLTALPERSRAVLEGRYGLGETLTPMTLEAIGKRYAITRERVRQIENHALVAIRKSEGYKSAAPHLDELERAIDSLGVVVPEDEFLETVADDQGARNYIHFLLVVGEPFKLHKEDEEFHHRWHVSDETAKKVEEALRRLYKNLSDTDLIPESEIITRFLEELEDVNERYKNEEIARRWLGLCKGISCNPLGEWGVAHSPNIRTKGIRDYAYLAIKRHGSPMHFTEVAKMIEKLFSKKAHVATCHNELIKDKRFVLVGRGLYALAEWGYQSGVVKDVIRDLLKKHGPLTRDEIVQKVLKERYVKENTIAVNLQNNKIFRRTKEGTYALAQA